MCGGSCGSGRQSTDLPFSDRTNARPAGGAAGGAAGGLAVSPPPRTNKNRYNPVGTRDETNTATRLRRNRMEPYNLQLQR